MHYAALRAAFAELGLIFERDWYFARLGLSVEPLCQAFEAEFGRPCPIDRLRPLYQAQVPKFLAQTYANEPVLQIARHYHGTLPLAVASGGDQRIVEKILEQISARELFDAVVAIGEIRRGKPAPDLFLAAAAKLGIEPEHCMVYEDSDEGLEAAHAAGMEAVDVRLLAAA
jgi:beta-phosphoglucomutase-like phosphatase (HAD superfamily)